MFNYNYHKYLYNININAINDFRIYIKSLILFELKNLLKYIFIFPFF